MNNKSDDKKLMYKQEIQQFREDIDKKTEQKQKAISERLSSYFNQKLEERNISYRKITERAGVSTSVIVDFFKGRNLPRIETLIRLSLAIAPEDIDNMFRQMFENPDSNSPATTEQLLQRVLIDLGLTKDFIIDAQEYIKYLQCRSKMIRDNEKKKEEDKARE